MKYLRPSVFILLMLFYSCSKDSGIVTLDVNDCISKVEIDNTNSAYDNYLKNRTLWDCQQISNYSYHNINKGIECWGTEHILEIEDNVIIDTTLVKLNFSDDFCVFHTIDELYTIIEVAVDPNIKLPLLQSVEEEVAELISIHYDTIIGIPIKIRIDYLLGLADEEFEYELSDFNF